MDQSFARFINFDLSEDLLAHEYQQNLKIGVTKHNIREHQKHEL